MMPVDNAVFFRIDTTNGIACLTGACGEAVASTLLAAHDKGTFDLLGFVVLPNELQLLIIPHGKPISDLLNALEGELSATASALPLPEISGKTVFDTDFYREKCDSSEEVRQRLRWMHDAPVRSRLATMSKAFPLSSANEKYRSKLILSQTIM
ncbi:MAG TPA: hypothetical protein VKQ72_19195 [Aggregatilineales bacterium]|nr:hypothetical protein [Aggregatilineales bacterium]